MKIILMSEETSDILINKADRKLTWKIFLQIQTMSSYFVY